MTTTNKTTTIVAEPPIMEEKRTMKSQDEVLTMKTLHEKGHSATKIARMLGCSHHTVLRYIENGFSKAPRAQATGALSEHAEFLYERFLRHDGNADVVRQELESELGVKVSLRSVQRALKPHRELLRASRLATPRFETKPGEQLQIDFGTKTVTIENCEQKVHLFVATLGFSRRIFAKAYLQETQTEWLDGLESAFAYFGGVPSTVLMDNAKALVSQPRHGEAPVRFNERVLAFSRYWDFKPRACRPYRARTKGKVERSVGYVKGNALAGREFASWGALDAQLATWLTTVADHRQLSDGDDTTPLSRFEIERKRLTAIDGKPPFGAPRPIERKVTADAVIELDTNRYSVPWTLIGCKVEVSVSATTVSVSHRAELVAEHPRCAGRHQRRLDKAHFQLSDKPTDPKPSTNLLTRPLSEYAAYVESTS